MADNTDPRSQTNCADCGRILIQESAHAEKPCPDCGSTNRNIVRVVSEGVLVFESVAPSLQRFVDRSSDEAERATTRALRDIALWVDDVDPLTARHVSDGNVKPDTFGVPKGPYTDEEVRQIVTTIRNERSERE